MTHEVANQFSQAGHSQYDPADRSGKSVLSLEDADGVDDFIAEASDGEWEMDGWCAERALERSQHKQDIAPSLLRGMIDAKAAKIAANPRQKKSTRGLSTGTPYCIALVASSNTRVQSYFAPTTFGVGKLQSIRTTAAGSHISDTGQSAVRSVGDLTGFALASLRGFFVPTFNLEHDLSDAVQGRQASFLEEKGGVIDFHPPPASEGSLDKVPLSS